jgi:hypothetical protein
VVVVVIVGSLFVMLLRCVELDFAVIVFIDFV